MLITHTQTGDTVLPVDEPIYFEVQAHADTKVFAVGITHDTISKFDQMGRTSSSWAVYVNRWMQVWFVIRYVRKNFYKIITSLNINDSLSKKVY